MLRAAVTATGLRQWAEQHGISPAYVSAVLNGKKPGGKIQRALGYSRREVYEREGSEA